MNFDEFVRGELSESQYHGTKIEQTILDLIKVFANEGHSGASAGFSINGFKRATANGIIDLDMYKTSIFEMSEDPTYDSMINSSINDLIICLYQKNHTTEENQIVVSLFGELASWKPINELMEDQLDFCNVGDDQYQSSRFSAVFKNGTINKPYYLDAIVWRSDSGSCFTGRVMTNTGEKISSSQFIRFPFKPKTFYIDVIEKEIAPDDYEHYVKDESQLADVFKYYEKKSYKN